MNLPYECAEGICRNTDGEGWGIFIILSLCLVIVVSIIVVLSERGEW